MSQRPTYSVETLIRVWGLGFRVEGPRFGLWCLVYSVWGLGFGVFRLSGLRAWGLREVTYMVPCFLQRILKYGVLGSRKGYGRKGFGVGAQGFGVRVWDWGLRVWAFG